MTAGPVHPVSRSPSGRLRTLVYLIVLALVMTTVVYPLRRYVVEPRREVLLGHHETPGRRLALASEFGFDMASGCSVRMVPGAAMRTLSDLPTETATVLLGGFRGPYVIWLWMKTQDERQGKGHVDLVDRYRQIAALQSDYPAVWTFLAWDLGWNVSVQWQSQEQRYQWIRVAVEFLREGARKNPHSVEILGQMGWIYAEKLGHSQDAQYFRKRVIEDEGRSTYLIAYEWYDRARKAGDRYGERGHGLSRTVQYSQACHAATYYATETTQNAYDALAASVEARKAGHADEAARKFAEGKTQMDEALRAWKWAHQEWQDHIDRFAKEEVSPELGAAYERFCHEAEEWTKNLQDDTKGLTPENVPDLLAKIKRPELL
jgi:hypothetical protein